MEVGVIVSQHLHFAYEASKRRSVSIAVHEKFRKNLDNRIDHTRINIIWYNNYKQVLRLINTFDWIYTRNPKDFLFIMYYKILNLSRSKIFYDFRALRFIETFYVNKSYWKSILSYLIELFAYYASTSVGSVSYSMSNLLRMKFGNRNIYITPCCIEKIGDYQHIISIKSKVNSDELKLVYVGSLNRWQCFSEIIYLYSSLSTQGSCALTVITNEVSEAERIVKRILSDYSKITIFSRNHSEVLELLPAFDFGFLIRENSTINNVASPIKFLEYTSQGVMPIISKGVGDYTGYVRENKLGVYLEDNAHIDFKLLDSLKKDRLIVSRLLEFSHKYTWQKYIPFHPLVT